MNPPILSFPKKHIKITKPKQKKNAVSRERNDLQDLRDAIERAEEAVSAASSDSPLAVTTWIC